MIKPPSRSPKKGHLSRLLDSGFGGSSNSLGIINHLLLQILHSLRGRAIQATAVLNDTGDLDDTDDAKEEVDSSKPGHPISQSIDYYNRRKELSIEEVDVQVVLGSDDHTPASPDSTGGHQSTVLGQGQLLGGTAKIGNTSNDESPLDRTESVMNDRRSQV